MMVTGTVWPATADALTESCPGPETTVTHPLQVVLPTASVTVASLAPGGTVDSTFTGTESWFGDNSATGPASVIPGEEKLTLASGVKPGPVSRRVDEVLPCPMVWGVTDVIDGDGA